MSAQGWTVLKVVVIGGPYLLVLVALVVTPRPVGQFPDWFLTAVCGVMAWGYLAASGLERVHQRDRLRTRLRAVRGKLPSARPPALTATLNGPSPIATESAPDVHR